MPGLVLVQPLLTGGYVLDNIAPAPNGWRVAFWEGTFHRVEAIYLLGLANNPTPTDPPMIVTFTYTPMRGWVYCEGEPDYCGLLPPGYSLAWYEAQDPNGHVPVPAATREEEQLSE